MATTQRQFPGSPVNGTSSRQFQASGATTGNKLTYTVPAGRQAKVAWASAFQTAGAATLQATAALNGSVIPVVLPAVSVSYPGGVCLDAGDFFRITVTILDAASLFDCVVAVEEYLAQ